MSVIAVAAERSTGACGGGPPPVVTNAVPTKAAVAAIWPAVTAAACAKAAPGAKDPCRTAPSRGTWASQARGPATRQSLGTDTPRKARATAGSNCPPEQPATSVRASCMDIGVL